MNATEATSRAKSKRRIAVEQLGGPRDAQMYYDTDLERPVVLTKKDGWGLSKRDYMKRTWFVRHPRCHVGDSGCEIETISQRTKLDRLNNDTYQPLTDECVEGIMDRAVEKNLEWFAVNSPHIPYDGDGGVNVYAEGECLTDRSADGPETITARDDPFEPTIEVEVVYGDDPKSITVTTDGESIPYERESTPEDFEDGVPFVPEGDRDGPLVEMRLDVECEECGDTAYDCEVVA